MTDWTSVYGSLQDRRLSVCSALHEKKNCMRQKAAGPYWPSFCRGRPQRDIFECVTQKPKSDTICTNDICPEMN
jgi:hypothetical protein